PSRETVPRRWTSADWTSSAAVRLMDPYGSAPSEPPFPASVCARRSTIHRASALAEKSGSRVLSRRYRRHRERTPGYLAEREHRSVRVSHSRPGYGLSLI